MKATAKRWRAIVGETVGILGSGGFVLVIAAAVAGAQTAAEKQKLEKAAVLLHGPLEPQVREGAHLCLEVNKAPAMELLLDVLAASQPHFRDIVWEVLPDFKDTAARKVAVRTMKAASHESPMHEWCAQLIGLWNDPELAAPLADLLGEKEPGVRAAAARSLGQLKLASAAKKLEKLEVDKEPSVRAVAIEALARIDGKSYAAALVAGLRDPDAGVRCALLGVLPALLPDRVEESSALLLHDADWRPRLQAVLNLGALATKGAVEALVAASGDLRPVVAAKATGFLQKISKKKFTQSAQWELWWKENRDSFEEKPANPPEKPAPGDDAKKESGDDAAKAPDPPEPQTREKLPTYHGLYVSSDHVAFVIDKSADMSKPLSRGGSKDQRAREELEATLDKLVDSGFAFEVWTYGDRIETWQKKPVRLDKKSEHAALHWLEGIHCSGAKNIWEVVEAVCSDPDVDTVYLLSSGEPEIGLYVHWNRVCAHLEELNRFHKIVVHTVAYNNNSWYREQLEHLASSTGGTYTHEE